LKEKSRKQELTRTEVDRKIAKESGRGLKKGNGTEQCREVERSSPEGNETIPSEQEPKKGREILKKLTQRAKELSKLIPVTKLMYSRARRVIAELPRPEGPLGTEPHWHHGKSKETHEFIFL